MADGTLAVLLRDKNHDATNCTRYALKCNDVAMSVAKTPIQIPIPQQSPELVDIGYFRPSITVTGIVDTVGGDPTNTTNGVAGMSSITFTRASVGGEYADGGTASAQTYYIPYKNALEEACTKWIFSSSTELQLEIGDAKYPIATHGGYVGATGSNRYANGVATSLATGGGIYKVAIQQARFQVTAGKEDRYDFSMQFIAESRLDVPS